MVVLSALLLRARFLIAVFWFLAFLFSGLLSMAFHPDGIEKGREKMVSRRMACIV